MTVFRQHCPREGGICSKSGLFQFLWKTKPREHKKTLGHPYWKTYVHRLTRWTHGIQAPWQLNISRWIVCLMLAFCFMHLCLLICRGSTLSERQTWDNACVLIRIRLDPCLNGQLIFLCSGSTNACQQTAKVFMTLFLILP